MSTSNASDIQVNWQDYFAVAKRRRWFFIVPFSAVIAAGLLVVMFATRIYEAQALIAVQNEKLINPLIQGLAMPTEVSDRLNTLREEILSWSNLTRLITAHKLDQDISKNDKVAFERLVQKLREDIKVKMKGRSLIEVNYQGGDPSTVQQLVNSLTDIVIERDTAIQEQEASAAVNFIEQELGVYRKKLEDAETKLREFKEVYMTQMPVATALNDQLKGLELQLSTLLIDNTEQHPHVIEVKRQIEEVRRRRDSEIARLVAKGVLKDGEAAKELTSADAAKAQAAYQAVVKGLEQPAVPEGGSSIAVTPQGTTIQFSDAAASSLTLAPREQQELVRLTRDYSVNETIYRGLLEKLERAKITGRLGEDKEGGKFAVIERARYPLQPVKPNLLQVFLISLVVGIGLGVGAVILAEYFDQAIQTADEASEFLEVPVLGSIPTIITETDLQKRRQRRSWTNVKSHSKGLFQRIKTRLPQPITTRVDQTLLRWGL